MKKHTNTVLLIVLLILLSAFVLTKVFRSPARESNFNAELFSVDTAQISRITFIQPGGKDKGEITVKKIEGVWTVYEKEEEAKTDSYVLKNVLQTLSTLEPERIVSRKKEKWGAYAVSDTSGFQLVAYNDDDQEVANWYVGKESQGMTYFRPAGEDAVYAIEGSLRDRLDRSFNEWRDKTFLHISKAFINRINFQYPADTGFVLSKSDDQWMINNEKADSASVQTYLNRLQAKDLSNFADNFSPSGPPDFTVVFEGTPEAQATVKAWKDTSDSWILTSSFQNEVYFRDTAFAKQLFTGKRFFLKAN